MKISKRATYKTRNTGTDQTFPGILLNIPRDLLAHSPESCSTFPGIFWNIPRNFKIITFPGILKEIPRNSIEHSPRSPHSVPRFCIPGFINSQKIPRNLLEHSLESFRTLPGIFFNIPRNLKIITFPGILVNIPRVPRIPRSCIPGFINNHQQSAILQFCKFFHLDLFRQMSAEKRIS